MLPGLIVRPVRVVPIAVANFDQRFPRTRVSAMVLKPFRLSDFVPDPVQDQALYDFVNGRNGKYRDYVKQAGTLARGRARYSQVGWWQAYRRCLCEPALDVVNYALPDNGERHG